MQFFHLNNNNNNNIIINLKYCVLKLEPVTEGKNSRLIQKIYLMSI